MDPDSQKQLDDKKQINEAYLHEHGSGDYTALDEYLSKYDSANSNIANNETFGRAVENDGNERFGESQPENKEQVADEKDSTENKSTLKETLATHANSEADTETQEKIKETEAKLEEAEIKLEESTDKVENAQNPEERQEAVDEQEKKLTDVNAFANALKNYLSGR